MRTIVYCSRCGTQNAEDANFCAKCGATLNMSAGEFRKISNHKHSSSIGTIIAGLIIIIIGFTFLISDVYNIDIPWWPLVIIAVGIWLLIRSIIRRHNY